MLPETRTGPGACDRVASARRSSGTSPAARPGTERDSRRRGSELKPAQLAGTRDPRTKAHTCTPRSHTLPEKSAWQAAGSAGGPSRAVQCWIRTHRRTCGRALSSGRGGSWQVKAATTDRTTRVPAQAGRGETARSFRRGRPCRPCPGRTAGPSCRRRGPGGRRPPARDQAMPC